MSLFGIAEQPRGTVKSVLKATHALRLFTVRQPEWGVTELARELGMSKTVVYNLAETLVTGGLLEKDASSAKYRVGLLAYQLGLVYGSLNDFHDTAERILTAVRDKINHTVQLFILDDEELLVLLAVESSTRLRVISMEGERRPIFASGGGRAILSTLSREELERVVPDELPAHTPATVTEKTELIRLLEEAAARGYAMQEDQLVADITSVAVPVRDTAGRGVAAISASFLSSQKANIDIDDVASVLVAASGDLSRAIGDKLADMADRLTSPFTHPGAPAVDFAQANEPRGGST